MRVGMTSDADEQRRVVHVRSPLLIEPDPLGEPQRDQALAQHVLHRLPKAEIHAERQRGDELGQPDVRAIGPPGHRPRLPRRAEPRKMRRTPHVLARASPVASNLESTQRRNRMAISELDQELEADEKRNRARPSLQIAVSAPTSASPA